MLLDPSSKDSLHYARLGPGPEVAGSDQAHVVPVVVTTGADHGVVDCGAAILGGVEAPLRSA